MRQRTSRDALEFISCDHLLLACSLPLRVVFSMRFTQRKVNFHILEWEMSLCLWPVPCWRGCCKLSFRLWWTLSLTCLWYSWAREPGLVAHAFGLSSLMSEVEALEVEGSLGQLSKTSSQKKIKTERALKWRLRGDHIPRVWEALGSNLSTPKQGKQRQQQ